MDVDMDAEEPSTSAGPFQFESQPTSQSQDDKNKSLELPKNIPGLIAKGSIIVSAKQRGNPVLKHIRNVPWEYDSDIVPDYILGVTTCALFLSIRYHNLHPDYIHDRLKELKGAFDLRILLVQIDVPDPYPMLKTLTHIAMLADLTIIPAHTAEEAGKILENYKIYENKPADVIQEKQDASIVQQVIDALTTIRSVNKTDAMTLLRVFGSLESLLEAKADTIALCPGVGAHKAKNIYSALQEKFKTEKACGSPIKTSSSTNATPND